MTYIWHSNTKQVEPIWNIIYSQFISNIFLNTELEIQFLSNQSSMFKQHRQKILQYSDESVAHKIHCQNLSNSPALRTSLVKETYYAGNIIKFDFIGVIQIYKQEYSESVCFGSSHIFHVFSFSFRLIFSFLFSIYHLCKFPCKYSAN